MSLKEKRLFLLDMDGTIYLDDYLFEGVLEFLDEIKRKNGRYIFMTNNSSKGVSAYIEKLKSLGIETTADDFMTSVDATIEFLKEKYGDKAFEKTIYIMGTKSFVDQMKDNGFKVVTDESKDVNVILCGFDRELTYKKLEDVSKMLLLDKERKIDYFATNPDWVCPTEFGSIPDCGSMCQMLEIATGRKPYFIGKPQPDMALLSMKKTGFSPVETVVIGDRLYTDIACGVNAGVDTCFVLSGEGTMEDLKKYDVKPTYILDDIKEILRRI